MTTFVLKKYSDQTEDNLTEEQKLEQQTEQKKEQQKKDEEVRLQIQLTGSVSSIVANALYKVLGNKQVELEEADSEDVEGTESSIRVVSTEEINSSPVEAYRAISEEDIVFIDSKGFTTNEEEWFLMNLEHKPNRVFYTVESLANYLVSKLHRG